MIQVLRWGLWMSPIIRSFLRPMGEPTWYNQDGGVRTLLAIVQAAVDPRLSPAGAGRSSFGCWPSIGADPDLARPFRAAVATLVNLSFLGMDRLDHARPAFCPACHGPLHSRKASNVSPRGRRC